jgi:hypothetical membrane protein
MGCAVLAIAVSMSAYPGYSIAEFFISRLGNLQSPLRWVFNCGLVLAGLLTLPFLASLHKIADNPHGHLAARAGTVAGIGMIMVGVFPGNYRVLHAAFALIMFSAATVATYAIGIGLLRPSKKPRRRRLPKPAGKIALAAFGFQIVLCVSGVAYAGMRAAQLKIRSAGQLLTDLGPNLVVQVGTSGQTVNPAAILEWAFFVATALLITLLSLCCIRKRF